MSVWPVAIQTLTPLGIGIIVVSKLQEPAAASRCLRPGQRAREFKLFDLGFSNQCVSDSP
jgi:hypothetical protein